VHATYVSLNFRGSLVDRTLTNKFSQPELATEAVHEALRYLNLFKLLAEVEFSLLINDAIVPNQPPPKHALNDGCCRCPRGKLIGSSIYHEVQKIASTSHSSPAFLPTLSCVKCLLDHCRGSIRERFDTNL